MIGIDLVKSSRFEKFLNRFGERGLRRFLSSEEIELVKSSQTAAGFWAIKEAFSKAIGTGIGKDCSFHDMKIYKTSLGAPRLSLSREITAKFKIQNVAISITHDGEYVIGVVTVESLTPTNKIKQF